MSKKLMKKDIVFVVAAMASYALFYSDILGLLESHISATTYAVISLIISIGIGPLIGFLLTSRNKRTMRKEEISPLQTFITTNVFLLLCTLVDCAIFYVRHNMVGTHAVSFFLLQFVHFMPTTVIYFLLPWLYFGGDMKATMKKPNRIWGLVIITLVVHIAIWILISAFLGNAYPF